MIRFWGWVIVCLVRCYGHGKMRIMVGFTIRVGLLLEFGFWLGSTLPKTSPNPPN